MLLFYLWCNEEWDYCANERFQSQLRTGDRNILAPNVVLASVHMCALRSKPFAVRRGIIKDEHLYCPRILSLKDVHCLAYLLRVHW